jgi:hypothetical protein
LHSYNLFSRRASAGNALFLVLIAVALFAMLAYAITQGGRGGGDTKKEQTTIAIAQVEDFAAQIQTALTRLNINANIPEWAIDYSDTYSYDAANTYCATTACKLFASGGGDVASGFQLPAAYQGAVAALGGKFMFRNSAVQGVGQDLQRDLYLAFPNASQAFCIAWNNHTGVPNPGGVPPAQVPSGADYNGVVSAQVTLAVAAPEITVNNGQSSFCLYYTAATQYYVFLPLIIR